MWTILKVFIELVTILLLFYIFFSFGRRACRILAFWPGMGLAPPALEGGVLTTGLPGKSSLIYFWNTYLLNFRLALNRTLRENGVCQENKIYLSVFLSKKYLYRIVLMQCRGVGLGGPLRWNMSLRCVRRRCSQSILARHRSQLCP